MSAAPTDDDPPVLISTRPYFIRALYEWCADNGLTPYIAVLVDGAVQVPREYVQDGQIVLNISADATSALKLDNDYIEFKARFGGKAREIIVPIDHVMAIYARENGQGMAFTVSVQDGATPMPGVSGEAGNATTSGQDPSASDAQGVHGTRGNIQLVSTTAASSDDDDDTPPEPPSPRPRPTLKRIK
jgi:stringent starvation protein B